MILLSKLKKVDWFWIKAEKERRAENEVYKEKLLKILCNLEALVRMEKEKKSGLAGMAVRDKV